MNSALPTRPANFCEGCAVRNRAICADLDSTEIAALNSIGRRRELKAGEHLMWEGDEAVLVANVIDGLLKLSTHTADGREQILGLVYPADFVGRPFDGSSPFGVEALSDTRVCVFERKDFERFARDHPRLEHKLLERTFAELDRTQRWMLLLGRMTAEQKIATFLLELADRLPATGHDAIQNGEIVVDLSLTRQQMADVLGLTIETVSRQLNALRKSGIIEIPGRREIRIHDRAALMARAA